MLGDRLHEPAQLVERVGPAVPVHLESSVGGELALNERHLGGFSEVTERQSDGRRPVVGIRFLPAEAVYESARRIDLEEFAGQMECIPVGGCMVKR